MTDVIAYAICYDCGRRTERHARDRRPDAPVRRLRRMHGGPGAAVCREWCAGYNFGAFTASEEWRFKTAQIEVRNRARREIAYRTRIGTAATIDPAVYVAAAEDTPNA